MKDKDRELRLILEKYYLPAISLDLAQGEIKALYKPLGKEELEKIMWEVARIEIGSPASIMLAQAIINARGEKR